VTAVIVAHPADDILRDLESTPPTTHRRSSSLPTPLSRCGHLPPILPVPSPHPVTDPSKGHADSRISVRAPGHPTRDRGGPPESTMPSGCARSLVDRLSCLMISGETLSFAIRRAISWATALRVEDDQVAVRPRPDWPAVRSTVRSLVLTHLSFRVALTRILSTGLACPRRDDLYLRPTVDLAQRDLAAGASPLLDRTSRPPRSCVLRARSRPLPQHVVERAIRPARGYEPGQPRFAVDDFRDRLERRSISASMRGVLPGSLISGGTAWCPWRDDHVSRTHVDDPARSMPPRSPPAPEPKPLLPASSWFRLDESGLAGRARSAAAALGVEARSAAAARGVPVARRVSRTRSRPSPREAACETSVATGPRDRYESLARVPSISCRLD